MQERPEKGSEEDLGEGGCFDQEVQDGLAKGELMLMPKPLAYRVGPVWEIAEHVSWLDGAADGRATRRAVGGVAAS